MNEKELETVAVLIAERLVKIQGACSLSQEEQEAVKDLIRTKKNAVKAFLWLCGALALWIIKDAYIYLIGHLTFK